MPIWKKCHKTICSIEIFRFLTFPLLSFKIPISASVLPVFWAFPVLGPIITSLTIVREAIMMGPWTGNAQKTGKTRRKWVFFNSTMEIVRNLKISMLQLAIGAQCSTSYNLDRLPSRISIHNHSLSYTSKETFYNHIHLMNFQLDLFTQWFSCLKEYYIHRYF